MHDIYKPFRNNLRKHSVFPSLYTAFRFIQFLDHDIDLPDHLNPPLRLGREDKMRLGIVQWEFEILIRELILNGDTHSKKDISSWGDVAKQINWIKRIENDAWVSHSGPDDDVLYELVRIAHRQFPWQHGINKAHYARYHRLYNHPGLAEIIRSNYGMEPTELFQISLGLAGHFLKNFSFKLPVTNQLNSVSSEICSAFISKFSIHFEDLKRQYISLASYDVNWAYTFNPLRKTPLLYLPNEDAVICPIPQFLIRRVTNELYFDLVANQDAFSLHFGPAVQTMIGDVAAVSNVSKSFTILPEARYGSKKAVKDSADWIISDQTAHLFIECKGARVKFQGISDLSSRKFIESEFARIKGFALQLYKTLNSALNGEYPHWQPDDRPIYLMVVTLEDWQTFGLHVQRLVFDPLKNELAASGINPDIVDKHPLSFSGIEDFELAINAADAFGIDAVFKRKNEGEYPQWSIGTFVNQNFSSELNNRPRGAFLEEWERIVPPQLRHMR